MKCEWIGLLHSPAGAAGQGVHRDGRNKQRGSAAVRTFFASQYCAFG